MLTECPDCGFYITSEDSFCPDCGLLNSNTPLDSVAEKIETILIIKIGGAIALGGLVGLVLFRLRQRDNFSDDFFRLSIIFLIIGLAITILKILLNVRGTISKEERKRYVSDESLTFQSIFDVCSSKTYQLDQKHQSLRNPVKRGVRLREDETKALTREPKKEIADLLAGYELLAVEIDFARLQNELLPTLKSQRDSKVGKLSAEDLENILAELDSTQSVASNYLTRQKARTESFLAAINETEEIIKSLIGRQNGASISENSYSLSLPEDLIRQEKVLNAHAALKNFSSTSDELERKFRLLMN